jgi:hypothetical protein
MELKEFLITNSSKYKVISSQIVKIIITRKKRKLEKVSFEEYKEIFKKVDKIPNTLKMLKDNTIYILDNYLIFDSFIYDLKLREFYYVPNISKTTNYKKKFLATVIKIDS